MKKSLSAILLIPGFLFFCLLFVSVKTSAQDVSKTSAPLPDSVNVIVTASCTPCHTSQGGLMSRTKLNFTEWINYSPEKQKEKAEKMYSELNKGAMPPKKAREAKPELIPTSEQVAIIKRWAESFPSDIK